jgi:hypothetical protein
MNRWFRVLAKNMPIQKTRIRQNGWRCMFTEWTLFFYREVRGGWAKERKGILDVFVSERSLISISKNHRLRQSKTSPASCRDAIWVENNEYVISDFSRKYTNRESEDSPKRLKMYVYRVNFVFLPRSTRRLSKGTQRSFEHFVSDRSPISINWKFFLPFQIKTPPASCREAIWVENNE